MQKSSRQDRRTQAERRTNHTSPLTFSSLFGLRAGYRRREDREQLFYVDRYSPRSVITILITFLLSITDAFFTLNLLTLGIAVEANPVMAYFLTFGAVPFLILKYVLTGGCLLWFLIHKNYRLFGRFSVKYLMISILALYVILILYEISLFLR